MVEEQAIAPLAAVADGESRSASMVRVQVETCAGMREASGVFVGADLVATSDATTGASGGAAESGLYFELRHLGQPINPQQWVGG